MSIKKNVASMDGKASHVPSTPSTLSSPPVEEQVEVKLDDKMLTTFLSDAKVFDFWKDLADAGGMLVPYGIKDAAHLEDVINKQGREVILKANVASAKTDLEVTTSVIMVNSKNKETLSPPGRCGLKPHRFGVSH